MKTEHWRTKHEWWVEDFQHWQECKMVFVNLLQRHPDDDTGDIFRSLIKSCDYKIKQLKKEYKKIYGVNFNMRRLDREKSKS